jgi:hypothetical protein
MKIDIDVVVHTLLKQYEIKLEEAQSSYLPSNFLSGYAEGIKFALLLIDEMGGE